MSEFLIQLICIAAWYDWEHQSYGTVTEYAGKCSETEWKDFQRNRARLQHFVDYL